MSERELPEGWAETTLGEIFRLQAGKFIQASEIMPDNSICQYPCYGGNGLRGYVKNYNYEGTFPLIGRQGALCGNVNYTSGFFYATEHAVVVSRLTDTDPLWMYYFLKELNLNQYSTATAQPGLSVKTINQVLIPLPPLNEQRRIAAKVEALQARSAKAKKALEKVQTLLEHFRQSVLAAAFRGDLTARWREEHPDAEPASAFLQRIRKERRKHWEEAELAKYAAKGKTPPKDWKKRYPEPVTVDTEGLPELPEGWCWASLDELIVSGPSNGYSPAPSLETTGCKSLKLSATSRGYFILDESTIKYISETVDINSDLWLKKGDILIQRANTIDLLGTTAIYYGNDFEYIYPDLMSRIRTTNGIVSEFICEYINSLNGKAYIKSVATGIAGNMPKINGQVLKKFPIPLPHCLEIENITTLLLSTKKACLTKKNICAENLISLSLLNQSILTKAFRGDMVAQDPADEPASVLLERIAAEAASSAAADAKPQQVRRGRKPKPAIDPILSFPAPGREGRLLRLMEYIIYAYPGLPTKAVEERAKLATYPTVCARLLGSRASAFRTALKASGEEWKFAKSDVVRMGRIWESLEVNYGILINREGHCTMHDGRTPESWPAMDTLLPLFNKAYTIFTAERHKHQEVQADLDRMGVTQKIA